MLVSTRVASASASLSRVRSNAPFETPSKVWSTSVTSTGAPPPLLFAAFARAPRPRGPASAFLAAVSARAIARQYSSPRPPTRTVRTSTSLPNPLCATEARNNSSPPPHSNAITGCPLAAAASEKNPKPAPTSTKTPPRGESRADNEPTSASAEVGALGSYRPACHPPHFVKLDPLASTTPSDALDPDRCVSMSNGGSNAALTGYPARSFTVGMA
mmetsp:Transcript_3342/g.15193  ORF Transcript_3342/g.15193 Transcript_3342/m.15193 type:complete len:215 (-) Transcript_3342:1013-1657(-)